MRSKHYTRAALAAALALVFVLPAQGGALTGTTWAVSGDAKISVRGVGRATIPTAWTVELREADAYYAMDDGGREYTGMWLMAGSGESKWGANYDGPSRSTLATYFAQWIEDQGVPGPVTVTLGSHKVFGSVRRGVQTIKQTTRFTAVATGFSGSGSYTLTLTGPQVP